MNPPHGSGLPGQHDNETDDADAEQYDGPSKSSRKREMHALQDLGEQLVALSADQLAKVPMPERLQDAVKDARRFVKHEARRRQMQYIGKLMRHIDPEPIQRCLDAFKGQSQIEIARHHRLERLRNDLIEDEQTLSTIVTQWPHADLQHLRTLRRNALKEQQQGKPPRAFREMFKMLRDLELSAGESATADAADKDTIAGEEA